MPTTLRIAAGAAIVRGSGFPATTGVSAGHQRRYHRDNDAGTMPPGVRRSTIQLVEAPDSTMTGLRLAVAALAVAATALVVWQKHLLTQPGPGLVLALACAVPFVLDARWPRLLRPTWSSVTAMLVVAGCATALLAYRPAEGDTAVLFFIVLAARAAAGAPAVVQRDRPGSWPSSCPRW